MTHRVLVTGGAGFVGSTLALELKRLHPEWEVVAFDNLKRRGSELSLERLSEAGVRFVHGDVRSREDLDEVPDPSVILDCAAEPSVLAGLTGGPAYVLDTNLRGTLHCMERARQCGAGFVFVSTSRVYPVATLEALPFTEGPARFELDETPQLIAGFSRAGIAESFGLEGARSIYGATKLCSELMIAEYVAAFGMRAVIDRCGLIAGPWQMGKVDQGVVTHWIASHEFGRPLRYIGYGGTGKQVRDVLHASDLVRLVDSQLAVLDTLRGDVFNVGGGRPCSTSLAELTTLCRRATSREVPITSEAETRVADVRIYLSDSAKAHARFGWRPEKSMDDVVHDIARWMRDHRAVLERTLRAG
jgi:CDP-paratose 2-epimerase